MNNEAILTPSAAARPRTRRKMRLSLTPLLAGTFLALVVVVAIFAPLLAPHSPDHGTLVDSLRPPVWLDGGSWTYPLGTDATGRDIFSRLLYGARIPILVVVFGIALTATFGSAIGLLAGYFGGIVDAVLMRIVDAMLSLPPILLAIVFIGVLGANLQNVIIVIVLTTWAPYSRIVRGEALRVRDADHVALARVAGCGTFRILRRHVLPEITNTLVVLASLSVSELILYEAALSFLGLGVRPPAASWGLMISEGRVYLTSAWWLTVIPGIALLLTCMSANLLGDWLRDKLDPRLRNVM